MKLSIATATILHLSSSFTSTFVEAQQAGTMGSEGHPTITLKECTNAGGCTSRQAKLTLDANWRWIHKSGTNCYTGNTWDTSICSDPVTCARECAVETISESKYRDTYGIHNIQDGVKMDFVTDHAYGTNVGSRLYVLDPSGENYQLFQLKNREFSFEVDVSKLMCGMNGAMYFSEMAANGEKGVGNNNSGAKYGTGYCDAQCPHDIKFIAGEANTIDWKPDPNDLSNNMGAGKYGACCAEMDIWEANSMANAYTPHTCAYPGPYRCEGIECGDNDKGERYDGVCDKDGCDINPYRMGNTDFYGRGSEYAVNTLKTMTVVTEFLTADGTDDGDLSEIRRYYVQDGNIIHSPSSTILGPGKDTDSITDQFCDDKKDLFGDVKDFQELGGMTGMGDSLGKDRGQVMIFSLWDDVAVNMLWLDSAYPLDKPVSDPGIKRGDCLGGVESTPTYLRNTYADSYVIFKNAAVGEIGSTIGPVTPTTPTPPSPTPPSPTPPSPTPPTSCGSSSSPCCSQDFNTCVSWCGTTESECMNCNQDVFWITCPNQSCKPRHGDCTNDKNSCCDGLTCVEDNPFYSQCRYVPPTPTPPGTPAPTKKATSSPTKNPTSSPTESTLSPTESTLSPTTSTGSPTAVPEGCFSNNYKTCLPEGYDSSNSTTCNLMWLPRGAQKNCLALWDECTDEPDSCCGSAECYGDSGYAVCIPKDETDMPTDAPSDIPSSSPTDASSDVPSSSPTQTCIVCDDRPASGLINRNQTCPEANNIANKCGKDNWKNNKFCQLTCYNNNFGYDGDVCCNGSLQRKLLRGQRRY